MGITTLFAFQVFANVAVVTNLFPVTGISLPFFSSGGSALIIQMAEMGLHPQHQPAKSRHIALWGGKRGTE